MSVLFLKTSQMERRFGAEMNRLGVCDKFFSAGHVVDDRYG